jgi:Fe-S cluster assembly protein SufB
MKTAGMVLEKGINQEVVKKISEIKGESAWMLEFRLKALEVFDKRELPQWCDNLSEINFEDICYYSNLLGSEKRTWEEVPDVVKETFDKLGIPKAERQVLAGVKAQYDSEVAYSSLMEDLKKQGVVFLSSDEGLKQYPEFFKEYFGKIIPVGDNKFSALNSAVWSGGSFVYIPKNVKVDRPLQAYFRINAERFGQFERTLIIVDEGASVQYVEGCSAPTYSTNSLHAGVVEIVVKKGGHLRYTTVQNWSNNVYNLVTKRARVEAGALMEWVDGNLGSKTTMKYPSCVLVGEGARGEMLSISFSAKGQTQDTGAKMIHLAANTSSVITSRSISVDGGKSIFRGTIQVSKEAKNAKAHMRCDSLILDAHCSSDSFPAIRVNEGSASVTHEATISKVDENKLFYLQSRGLSEEEALNLIVLGFIEPVSKELPIEYAVEFNRFIELSIEEKQR